MSRALRRPRATPRAGQAAHLRRRHRARPRPCRAVGKRHRIDGNLSLDPVPSHSFYVGHPSSGSDRAVFAGDVVHSPVRHRTGCSGCFREARARPPRLASPCSNAPPTRADSWCPHLTGAGAAEVRREGSRLPSLGGHPRQADGPWRLTDRGDDRWTCGERRGEPAQVRRDRARPVTGGIRTGLDLPQSPVEDFLERVAAEAGCTRSSTARGVPAGHARRPRYGSRRPSR